MADVRQLRYFLAVADRLSFSQAALDLHLSQSALSEAVRKLEVELGVELLRRSSRRVTLTVAGEALADAAPAAVQAFDDVLARAQEAARGEAGRLRVGFEAAGAGALDTRARARFMKRFPHVRVQPRRFEWGGEVTALRAGECDVAFAWLPADTSGLVVEPVVEEPRYAGLACEHPLAAHDTLSISQLDAEPILWTRQAPRPWVDWWAVNPRPSGAAPTWGPENDNAEEMLAQAAAGAGYCIVPRAVTEFYARPDLVWREIVDVEPLRVALVWRQHEASPLVAAFAEVVRELARARSG